MKPIYVGEMYYYYNLYYNFLSAAAKYEPLEKSLHTHFLFGATSTNHSFAGTFRGWCREIQMQNI